MFFKNTISPVSSVKRKNRKERVENKKCPHDCPLSLLTTSWFNHLSFYNFWGMGLVYRGLELTRCRPFTSESHTHHLIYLPSKLCWIIRLHTNKQPKDTSLGFRNGNLNDIYNNNMKLWVYRKTTGNQSSIIQKIDSSEGIFIVRICFKCSLKITHQDYVTIISICNHYKEKKWGFSIYRTSKFLIIEWSGLISNTLLLLMNSKLDASPIDCAFINL